MTIKRNIELDCPNCGANSSVPVWDTINAQVSPEARTALLRGEINVLHCEKCKKKFRIATSLLYHDMQNKFMAWYFPFAWVQSGEILNAIASDRQAKVRQCYPKADYAANIHYVFDIDELVRYIKFRDVLAEKMGHGPG